MVLKDKKSLKTYKSKNNVMVYLKLELNAVFGLISFCFYRLFGSGSEKTSIKKCFLKIKTLPTLALNKHA